MISFRSVAREAVVWRCALDDHSDANHRWVATERVDGTTAVSITQPIVLGLNLGQTPYCEIADRPVPPPCRYHVQAMIYSVSMPARRGITWRMPPKVWTALLASPDYRGLAFSGVGEGGGYVTSGGHTRTLYGYPVELAPALDDIELVIGSQCAGKDHVS